MQMRRSEMMHAETRNKFWGLTMVFVCFLAKVSTYCDKRFTGQFYKK